jgi:hypothetical protein
MSQPFERAAPRQSARHECSDQSAGSPKGFRHDLAGSQPLLESAPDYESKEMILKLTTLAWNFTLLDPIEQEEMLGQDPQIHPSLESQVQDASYREIVHAQFSEILDTLERQFPNNFFHS